MRLANSDFARLLFWRFVLVVKKENWTNKNKNKSKWMKKEESKNKNGAEKMKRQKRNHIPSFSWFKPFQLVHCIRVQLKAELMNFPIYIAVQIGLIAQKTCHNASF